MITFPIWHLVGMLLFSALIGGAIGFIWTSATMHKKSELEK